MDELSDRERILLYIIRMLEVGSYHHADGAKFGRTKDLQPGDLVLASSSPFVGRIHEWTLSEIVRRHIDGWVVKDIVTGEERNYLNEDFIRITGLDRTEDVFLCGDQRAFMLKVKAAFARGKADEYRYHRIHFDGPRRARISIRCKFWGSRADEVAVPFEVPITFSKRTSIAAILRTLIAGGYGTHQWVYEARKEGGP